MGAFDNFKLANYDKSLVSPELFGRFLSSYVSGEVIAGFEVVPGTGLKVTVKAVDSLSTKPSTALIPYGTNGNKSARMVSLTTDFDITISNPDPSNPRIDSIVLFVNNGVTLPSGTPTSANLDGLGVANAIVVNGMPNASPTAPNASAIQTAIGSSSYPYIVLANVRVDTGVSVIASNKITDMRSIARPLNGRVPTLRATRRYTSNATWTKPTDMGPNGFVRIKMVGGGGAGGGAPATTSGQRSLGNGGNSGVHAESVIPAASLAATVAVTVGAAGAGVSGANGNPGGPSSFGSLVVAPGGDGGVAAVFSSATLVLTTAFATVGGTGDSLVPGRPGSAAFIFSDTSNSGKGGDGGVSPFGTPAMGARANSAVVENASGYGAGGGGMSNSSSRSASTGSNGSPGIVIVEEYY